jgi:hypothetical protein
MAGNGRFLPNRSQALPVTSLSARGGSLRSRRIPCHIPREDHVWSGGWLHFQTGSARLLPRLISGRSRGPLFLADRRPVPARTPATVDRCPETGRVRLSYRRAEALFRESSGGWTLHQLRHSASLTWLSRM